MRYLAALILAAVAPLAFAQDVNEKNEKEMKAAVAKVAPSIVKIETVGGQDVVPSGPAGPGPRGPGVRKGVGPTTGLVVAADGYIITSSFNFANKPTDIFVTLPNHPGRLVAKQVAIDTTRMLTLIKVDAKNLPVPTAVPKGEVAIGQWSLALGRTLMPDVESPPSVSAGIISALGRINGKCLQTDAKVSPVNYGGPLVGIDGRVQGVLVPASQNGEGDVSGVEWYDSGIGFAIPFEDVLAVVPRLREGKNLRRGLLGITPQSQEQYLAAVVIGTISPDSAAAKAGLKVGDKIVSLDKKPVPHMVAMQHILGPKYEGDVIDVKVLRDGNELDIPGVKLTGVITAVASGFLGILPLRDDPDPGVPVRFVYPKSPAEVAGLKVGDRIMKVAPVLPGGQKPTPVELTQGRAQLNAIVGRTPPGQELSLEVKRKDGGKTDTLKVKLVPVPDEDLPDALPLPSSAERALDKPKGAKEEPKAKEAPKKEEPKKDKDDDKKDDEKKEPEVGMLKKKNAVLGREYWVYVPLSYKPNVSHGVIVWMHPGSKGGKDADDMVKIWRPFLEDQHYIMVGPKAQGANGWVASEAEGVMQDVKEVINSHTVDRSRVIVHGMGDGGQMAFYLGFHARDTIRGVATTGAALGNQPKDIVPGQPLAFFVVGGEKDPAVKSIAESIPPLKDKKFPVIYRQLKDFGKEYMLQPTLIELCVWIDSIDKI